VVVSLMIGVDTEGVKVAVLRDNSEEGVDPGEEPNELFEGPKPPGMGLDLPLSKPSEYGVLLPLFSALLYWMIFKILLGSLLEVITVVTPAAVAISAAMSFVSIPPVPRLDPRVAVLTMKHISGQWDTANK